MKYFMTRLLLDSSSMTRWRKGTGPKGFEAMLRESLATAMRMKFKLKLFHSLGSIRA